MSVMKGSSNTAAVQISITAKFKDATDSTFVEAPCYDISKGGMFIRTTTPLPIATEFNFECRGDGLVKDFTGIAKVAWWRKQEDTFGPPGMGVKFIRLTSDAYKAIDRIYKLADERTEVGDESSVQVRGVAIPPPRPLPSPLSASHSIIPRKSDQLVVATTLLGYAPVSMSPGESAMARMREAAKRSHDPVSVRIRNLPEIEAKKNRSPREPAIELTPENQRPPGRLVLGASVILVVAIFVFGFEEFVLRSAPDGNESTQPIVQNPAHAESINRSGDSSEREPSTRAAQQVSAITGSASSLPSKSNNIAKSPRGVEPTALAAIGEDGDSLIDRARRCFIENDYGCVKQLLAQEASTAEELSLLIESYLASGEKRNASERAREYLEKYPSAERADKYRQLVSGSGNRQLLAGKVKKSSVTRSADREQLVERESVVDRGEPQHSDEGKSSLNIRTDEF